MTGTDYGLIGAVIIGIGTAVWVSIKALASWVDKRFFDDEKGLIPRFVGKHFETLDLYIKEAKRQTAQQELQTESLKNLEFLYEAQILEDKGIRSDTKTLLDVAKRNAMVTKTAIKFIAIAESDTDTLRMMITELDHIINTVDQRRAKEETKDRSNNNESRSLSQGTTG